MAKRIVAQEPWIASDFSPETFGRLTTVSSVYKPEGSKCTLQDFVCTCGNKVTKNRASVKFGNTRSCGCLKTEVQVKRSTTHGLSRSVEYRLYYGMLDRCSNPNTENYCMYGGRGITVCDRWREPNGQGFLNFLSDMGLRPSPDHEIERKEVNGNYCPENCCWATHLEQMNNTRHNRYVTYDGRTQTLSQWAREKGWLESVIRNRLDLGWTVEEAFITTKKGRNEPYTYNGETKTLPERAETTGISYITLCSRKKSGWTLHEMLSTKVGEPRRTTQKVPVR